MIQQFLQDGAHDIKFALRQMRRSVLGTFVIVITLGLGVGANATMIALADRLLMQPPPGLQDASRIVRLFSRSQSADGRLVGGKLTNFPVLRELERSVPAFDAVAGYAGVTLSLGAGETAVRIRATMVSNSFFAVIGMKPAIGSVFGYSGSNAQTQSVPLVILSDGFWRRQFGSSPRIIGMPLHIGDATFTVAGVAPAGFRGLEAAAPDVWLPVEAAVASLKIPIDLNDRVTVWLNVVAHLRAGATLAVAEAQASPIWAADRGGNKVAARVILASSILARGPDAPKEVRVAFWLTGVSLLVLLLVAANVSSILLGRGLSRRHEFAIRYAIGASRARIARQTLVEAIMLTTIGGITAVGVAAVCGKLLAHAFVFDVGDGRVGMHVVGLIAVVGVVTVVLIGAGPMLQATSGSLLNSLVSDSVIGRGKTRPTRTALLAAQAALCTTLLTVAGLFAVSLRNVERLDLGVDLNHTLVARFDIGGLALSKSAVDTAYDEMVARVLALPGIKKVAFAQDNPYRGGRAVAIHPPERDQDYYWHVGVPEIPMLAAVGPGYFETVGARSLRGRDFSQRDSRDSPPVAIINDPLANILWPGQDPLGRCVYLPLRAEERGGNCVTIVGVLKGFWKYDILNRDVLAVYIPLVQDPRPVGGTRPNALYIRTAGNASEVAANVRHAIQGIRRDLPAVSVASMASVVEPEQRPWRFAATVFTLFGILALAVAGIGIFGVVAFAVTQRAREIAVRRALGARGADIIRTVAGESISAVVAGLILGLAIAVASGGWIQGLLFETSASDPLVLMAVVGALLAITTLALTVPLRTAIQRPAADAIRS
jgi:predicted permease